MAEEKSSNLKDLMEKIRSRPQMYVGHEGLSGLDGLLKGWKLHRRVCEDEDAWADRFFSEFHDFAAQKVGSQKTRGWCYFALEEAENKEREPFDVFFDWLDEFDTI